MLNLKLIIQFFSPIIEVINLDLWLNIFGASVSIQIISVLLSIGYFLVYIIYRTDYGYKGNKKNFDLKLDKSFDYLIAPLIVNASIIIGSLFLAVAELLFLSSFLVILNMILNLFGVASLNLGWDYIFYMSFIISTLIFTARIFAESRKNGKILKASKGCTFLAFYSLISSLLLYALFILIIVEMLLLIGIYTFILTKNWLFLIFTLIFLVIIFIPIKQIIKGLLKIRTKKEF